MAWLATEDLELAAQGRAREASAVVVVVVEPDGRPSAAVGSRDALRLAHTALERVVLAGAEPDELAGEREHSDADLLTTREVALALGISVSTARRWSDEGRLRPTRTTGGHRRFRAADLRGLAREAVAPARLRLAPAPDGALQETATALRVNADQLADATTRVLYEPGSIGWFGLDAAADELRQWFGALADSCRSGSYDLALTATARLVKRARAAGATPLECVLFLERLSGATARLVSRREEGACEVKDLLRLFVVLRQAALR